MPLSHEAGKISGTWIDFGPGGKYLIPPLNLEALEQLEEDFTSVTKADVTLKQQLTAVAKITSAAAQRNYPQLDLAFMKKWIDVGNMQNIFKAVASVSGFEEAEPGEAVAKG